MHMRVLLNNKNDEITNVQLHAFSRWTKLANIEVFNVGTTHKKNTPHNWNEEIKQIEENWNEEKPFLLLIFHP